MMKLSILGLFFNLTKKPFGNDLVIESPDYPNTYSKNTLREWHIHASNPNRRISINFEFYNIEKLDSK